MVRLDNGLAAAVPSAWRTSDEVYLAMRWRCSGADRAFALLILPGADSACRSPASGLSAVVQAQPGGDASRTSCNSQRAAECRSDDMAPRCAWRRRSVPIHATPDEGSTHLLTRYITMGQMGSIMRARRRIPLSRRRRRRLSRPGCSWCWPGSHLAQAIQAYRQVAATPPDRARAGRAFTTIGLDRHIAGPRRAEILLGGSKIDSDPPEIARATGRAGSSSTHNLGTVPAPLRCLAEPTGINRLHDHQHAVLSRCWSRRRT